VADSIFTLNWNPPVEPEYPLISYEIHQKINAGAFDTVAYSSEPIYTETMRELGTDYYTILFAFMLMVIVYLQILYTIDM
jgi:hypothetical protein